MNLTLSVDEKLVEKAREVARAQGTSLQGLIRKYIETLAGKNEACKAVEQLRELWRESHKRLKGVQYKWRREDAYEDRMARLGPKRA